MKNKKIFSKLILGIIFVILVLWLYDQRTNIVDEENLEKQSIEKKEDLADITNNPDIKVTISEKSTWQSGNFYYSNYEFLIENSSNQNINDWFLTVFANQKIESSQTWNMEFEIQDDKMMIKGTEYNKKILAGESVSVGGIFYSESKIEISGYEISSDGDDFKIEENVIEKEDIKNIISNNENSPVELHGKLAVKNKNIVDKDGNIFIIQGVSTHSINEFSEYINLESFKYLKEEMNCNTIRLALYSDSSMGYSKELHTKIDEGIEYATSLGLYVIIDWHILSDNDPNINKESAKEFFTEMANKYKDYDNILYEICNEPNGDTTWKMVKEYALEMIPLIREIDSDSIIIIGTPNYCQKIEDPIDNPIEGYDNLLYSLHFYSASHTNELRDSLSFAYKKDLPIIVSEFGLSEASGTGNINTNEADIWIDFLREKGIGYIVWNLSNKDETSALLKPETESTSGWSDEDLSEEGLWIKNKYNM